MPRKQEIIRDERQGSTYKLKNEEESRRIAIGSPRRGNIDYGGFKFSIYKYHYAWWSSNNLAGLERQSHRHAYILTHVQICVRS